MQKWPQHSLQLYGVLDTNGFSPKQMCSEKNILQNNVFAKKDNHFWNYMKFQRLLFYPTQLNKNRASDFPIKVIRNI